MLGTGPTFVVNVKWQTLGEKNFTYESHGYYGHSLDVVEDAASNGGVHMEMYMCYG